MTPGIGNAILYAAIGAALFCAAAFALKQTRLWRASVDDKNISASIVLAAILLGLAFIISSAVH